MASMDTNGSKLTNMFNPQVVGDMIEAELANYIRLAPLCVLDNTLNGTPGSIITLPSWAYIGAAGTVNEGAAVSIAQLTASTTTATIHKIAKGIELSDEAVLSGYGDPMGEAVKQLTMSIADCLDNEVATALAGIGTSMTYYTGSSTFDPDDDVNNALLKFGEKIDGEKVLIVTAAQYAVLRKATAWLPVSEIAAEKIISGVVGEIYGCQVIISNRIVPASGDAVAYIVKPGALRIFLKRDTLVETDRDIINKYTILTADKHEVVYLYDSSKAIKIDLGTAPQE